jgi:hypothetical protein
MGVNFIPVFVSRTQQKNQLFYPFFCWVRDTKTEIKRTLRIFRYPKWAQTFENQLSFEFKSKISDALLVYTDDGGVQGNFYVVTIVDGHVQLDFRLGDEQDSLINRPVINLRVDSVNVSDNRWHKFVLFQVIFSSFSSLLLF